MGTERVKRSWLWRSLATILGGMVGFTYYYYIGCATGSCPITGNPWISTMYGAAIGWLMVLQRHREVTTEQNRKGH